MIGRFEVQTLMGSTWENCWHEDAGADNPNGTPTTFATKADARAEITEHLKTCRQAVKDGNMSDVPRRSEFRIVPLTARLEPKGKRTVAKPLHPRHEVEAVTACAVWEAMLELNRNGFPGVPELKQYWDNTGTATLRLEAVILAKLADDVWNALPLDARDCWTWDWEFLPSFVARLHWDNGPSNPFQSADELALAMLLEYEARAEG